MSQRQQEVSLEDKQQTKVTLLEAQYKKRKLLKPHRKANDLDGQTWTKYSISIWSDIRKTPEEVALGHPALFPVELPRRLLRCFTTDDDEVALDPFVGLGSTVLAAEELGKAGIGLDIYPNFINKARERLGQLSFLNAESQSCPESKFHCVDARHLTRVVSINSVDIVITSPPYWDIHLQKRTADRKSTRPYKGTDTFIRSTDTWGNNHVQIHKL